MSWQPNEDYNNFGASSNGNKLTDFERSARDAGVTDRTVLIRKPLGLVLEANSAGDVYVAEVVKGGNAESCDVKKGDIIAMCSATFGRDMWSTRGVGLDRVQRAIQVRSGTGVNLVLQSKAEQQNFLKNMFAQAAESKEVKIEQAVTKRKDLENEILAERKQAAKGWFGLF